MEVLNQLLLSSDNLPEKYISVLFNDEEQIKP